MPETAPPLLIDLAEPILVCCVHLVAAASLWQPAAIHVPLTVLSRAHAPLVTKAALMQMPHVDLTFATKLADVGLLNLMLEWSKKPNGRPLNYAPMEVVALALERGLPSVLDWWLNESGLIIDWDWSNRALVHALCGEHHIMWLEWWKRRGFPYLEDRVTFPQFVAQVSTSGRVVVLDWLLNNLDVDRVVPKENDPDVLLGAAAAGHVDVLEWWMANAQTVMCARPEFNKVLGMGFRENKVAVLAWCTRYPQMADAWRQQRIGRSRSASFADCVYVAAVRHGLMHCFDALRLQPYDNEIGDASIGACQTGNLHAVKSLFKQGTLVGSRLQLIQEAMVSGNLELLDWIQANISDAVPDSSNGCFVLYRGPYVTACGVENAVCVLDWLTANGYPLPPHESDAGASASPYRRPASRETMLEAAVHQYHQQKISVLDWVLAHCFADKKVDPTELAKCLIAASSYGCVDVLVWMTRNWSKLSDFPSLSDLDSVTIVDAVERATRGNHGAVLNWWSDHVVLANVDVSSLSSNPRQYSHLHAAFSGGRSDIIEWWLHQSGPLKDCFDLGREKPYLVSSEYSDPSTFAGQVAALKMWVQDGQSIDAAELIHSASIHGRIDVLDWLLKDTQANVSIADFTSAWSDARFVPTSKQSPPSPWTHGESLMWWRANLPEVVADLSANRGPFHNPIHAHMMECATRNPRQFHQALVSACKNVVVENTAMLTYLKSRGYADLLGDICRRCLLDASQLGMVHALEWWKSCSGVSIACPQEVVSGRSIVRKRPVQWWEQSGLASNEEVARMTVPA